MLRWFVVVAIVLGASVRARAAPASGPAADIVVVWAPGRDVTPVGEAVRAAGAALVDRSPTRPDPEQGASVLATTLQRGIAAYDALRFDDAWAALEEAKAAADRTGAVGLAPGRLGDLLLYRSLVRAQRGDPDGAWDELVGALVIEPTRVLDPARFAPRIVEDFERARTAVTTRARATVEIVAPRDCTVLLDGAPLEPAASVPSGVHWARAACTAHEPWGARITVAEPSARIVAAVPQPAAPVDDDLLVQARAASARTVLAIAVGDTTATLRLLRATDGRELARRTVAVASSRTTGPRALDPVAAATRALLVPVGEEQHWYRSRWAYAGAAAILAAAIAIPLTAAFAGSDTPSAIIAGPP